jgi:2-dehydropantoate 2-reductase
MKITILGAGALGSVIGGLLSKEHDVTLIARSEHAEAISKKGLRISGQLVETFYPHTVTTASLLPEQDLVLITTKAYDTENAATQVAPLVGKNTIVASLQNGMGNAEILEQHFGDRAVIGVPFLGATYLEPGMIRLAGLKEVVVGHARYDISWAKPVAEIFSAAGIPSRAKEDINPMVWLKAIVNASINPLTVMARMENGFILEHKELLGISKAACNEGGMAAKSNAIALEVEDPFETVLEVLRTTAKNRSSMLQDVERGKRTEIDQINGALVRKGEDRGVPMPVNRSLWELIRSL